MFSKQLRASVTATIQGTVYFDMPKSGRVKAITLCLTPTASLSDMDYVLAEISLNANQQCQVNDANGVLAVAGSSFDLTTSGATNGGVNFQVLCNYPLNAGQRIYLNVVESGSCTWDIRALVCWE